jgi:hypothetical protein
MQAIAGSVWPLPPPPPGAPTSITYSTTSTTTVLARIFDPSTGSPFTQYRVTTTPTTSTFTSASNFVSATGLTASTSYTLTGSVSNVSGYGPGLTSTSFTTAVASWTTTGFGTLSSTLGADRDTTAGLVNFSARYVTTTNLAAAYILSGTQTITNISQLGPWISVSNTSGTLTYSKKVDGTASFFSKGAGGFNAVVYLAADVSAPTGQTVAQFITFNDSSGTTRSQNYYINTAQSAQGLFVQGNGTWIEVGPNNKYAVVGGRMTPPSAQAGQTGGSYLVLTEDGGVPFKPGFLDSSGLSRVTSFDNNNTFATWSGWDERVGYRQGMKASNGIPGAGINVATTTCGLWHYFPTVVTNAQLPDSTNVFLQVTVATDTSGSGPFKLGTVYSQGSNYSRLWGRILSSASSHNLSPGVGMASDTAGNVYNTGVNDNTGNPFIVKYNVSGTIQWQREFVATGTNMGSGGGILSIALEGTTYLCLLMRAGGIPGKTGYCRIPTDGTKTGTYMIGSTQVVYQASSYTDANFILDPYDLPTFSMTSNRNWSNVSSSLTITDANLAVQAVTV